MKFTLQMNLDNDAFKENSAYEVARILNRLGTRLIDHPDLTTQSSPGSLHDKNGNRVGFWEVQ